MQALRTSPKAETASSKTGDAIRIQNVAKNFGDVAVLRDVSLDIRSGEFLTLLGPSGSGKTTLLNVIAGFTRVSAGQVFFAERNMTLVPPNKRGVGVVFQSYALFPHMSVAENVAFPLRVRNFAKAEMAERVERALDLVQLQGLGGRRIFELSGGQRQRVALARAIVFRPSIILMDEPLSALDKQLRERMQIELRRLHEQLGSTTIYVTHDQREALTMSDRIAVMNHGRIVQLGAPRDIYENPVSEFVADFIGESTLIPVARAGERAVKLGQFTLTTVAPTPAGGELVLAIRSEKLMLSPQPAADVNLFEGVIADLIFQGESTLILLELPGGVTLSLRRMLSDSSMSDLPAKGDKVQIGLRHANTVVIARGEGG